MNPAQGEVAGSALEAMELGLQFVRPIEQLAQAGGDIAEIDQELP